MLLLSPPPAFGWLLVCRSDSRDTSVTPLRPLGEPLADPAVNRRIAEIYLRRFVPASIVLVPPFFGREYCFLIVWMGRGDSPRRALAPFFCNGAVCVAQESKRNAWKYVSFY